MSTYKVWYKNCILCYVNNFHLMRKKKQQYSYFINKIKQYFSTYLRERETEHYTRHKHFLQIPNFYSSGLKPMVRGPLVTWWKKPKWSVKAGCKVRMRFHKVISLSCIVLLIFSCIKFNSKKANIVGLVNSR